MATTRTKVVLAGLTACGAALAGLRQGLKQRGLGGGGGGESPPPAPAPPATGTTPPADLTATAGTPAAADRDHRDIAPPQPSNYDAAGPVANTATPIAAPDHHPRDAIDEAAEEAAAAAEAAAIGGGVPDYPGVGLSEHADEAYRPVEEGGGGEAEGQEITEMELVEAAQPSDTMSDAQRQIEETIEAQSNLHSGETPDPLPLRADSVPAEAEQAAHEGEGRGPSMGGDPVRPPADGGDEETWSGRAGGP